MWVRSGKGHMADFVEALHRRVSGVVEDEHRAFILDFLGLVDGSPVASRAILGGVANVDLVEPLILGRPDVGFDFFFCHIKIYFYFISYRFRDLL